MMMMMMIIIMINDMMMTIMMMIIIMMMMTMTIMIMMMIIIMMMMIIMRNYNYISLFYLVDGLYEFYNLRKGIVKKKYSIILILKDHNIMIYSRLLALLGPLAETTGSFLLPHFLSSISLLFVVPLSLLPDLLLSSLVDIGSLELLALDLSSEKENLDLFLCILQEYPRSPMRIFMILESGGNKLTNLTCTGQF